MSSQPKGLRCQAVRPVHLGPVVPRAPAADVDVDEVDVEGQSCGLHGVSDRAVQQADTWTDRKGHRDQGSWGGLWRNETKMDPLKDRHEEFVFYVVKVNMISHL